MPGRKELVVRVEGDRIDAWHYGAENDSLVTAAGRPCVVMAHGIGATQDSGLDGFARRFVEAGIEVITFDYRHFGASGGSPRQLVDPARQIADYHAVVEAARVTPGIDPTRIAVWGVSFSGGHVLRVAAQDPRIAGLVALTPSTDGLAVVAAMLRSQRPVYFARMLSLALSDVLAAALRREPVTVPIVGPPGSAAALNSAGATEGMYAIAGPSWRNAFAARLFLTVAGYRPTTSAKNIVCPALVQVADHDQSAPPAAAARAARKSRATVHHYPCDHFDVYPGGPWHDATVADQIAFFIRVFKGTSSRPSSPLRRST